MSNITPIFEEILVKNGVSKPNRQSSPLTLENVEDFLQEAYKIHSQIVSLHVWLRDIRHSYLSTAQPSKLALRNKTKNGRPQQLLSDKDREQIDANAKAMLRELNSSIRNLSAAEDLRHETQVAILEKKRRGGLGALGAWAAGGGVLGVSAEHKAAEEAEQTISMHRGNVIFVLRERLQECGSTQQAMMETRLTREMEKSRSILAMAKRTAPHGIPSGVGTGGKPASSSPAEVEYGSTYRPEEELTAEQIQTFERQNQDMVREDEATLNQVRTAEKSLVEIVELQTELVNNLTMQSTHIEQLVSDSQATAENVGGGNKELQKATEKPSWARRMFFSTSAFCAFLILWDLVF